MKRLLILSAITIVLVGLFGFWLKSKTQNDTILSRRPLTKLETECARQIVATNDLILVQRQADNQLVAVGYMIDGEYYVPVFQVDPMGLCEIYFQEEVFECYAEILAALCDKYEYKITPKNVQVVELTGDQTPEIYVWYDIQDLGRYAAHHIFYQKQSDGSNQALLHLWLCPGFSTVTIVSEPPRIEAVEDLICDTVHGRKEYLEYSLAGGTLEVLRDEIESEFGQER
jgi:hypothetical protein